MPTFELSPRFKADLDQLTPDQRQRFKAVVVNSFVNDLRTGTCRFRPGLRIKGVRSTPGVFELTWAPGGRATWQYGPEQIPGECHIVWRRIGSHDILTGP